MARVDNLRYSMSLLGGILISAVIFLIIQGLMSHHQFQILSSPASETNSNPQNNYYVPAMTAVKNLAAPGAVPKFQQPPLPESAPDLTTFSPPALPQPDLPLPNIQVPFNTIGGASQAEFSSTPRPAAGGTTAVPRTLKAGDLVLVRRVDPKYPAQAALQGIQGSVTLRFTVEPDGSVSGPVVTAAKPQRGIFDDAALRAVLQWKFKPLPVATTTSVTLVFNLGNSH